MSRQSLAALEPILERDQLADRTYAAIRDAVLAERIPAGTPLSVPELARRLGVSRSPVREAVQRLIYEGLATQERYRGAVVNGSDLAGLLDLFAVREPLEGLAASLATKVAELDDIARLRSMLAEHESLVEHDGDVARHIEFDTRFHREIRLVADNQYLSSMLESIATLSHSTLRTLWDAPNAASLAFEEHKRIVDCIEAGDQSLAEAVAREHISRVRVRLRRALVDAAPEPA
ncbi:GntR family transcriptional regulator [Humibacter antri]